MKGLHIESFGRTFRGSSAAYYDLDLEGSFADGFEILSRPVRQVPEAVRNVAGGALGSPSANAAEARP